MTTCYPNLYLLALKRLHEQIKLETSFTAYGASKTAIVALTIKANRSWQTQNIYTYAILPGSALTGLYRCQGEDLKRKISIIQENGSPNPILKTIQQGTATSTWTVTTLELDGGGKLILELKLSSLKITILFSGKTQNFHH